MKIAPNAALLIVDVQNDFLPGGALAVPNGDRIKTPLLRVASAFVQAGLPIYMSADRHSPGSPHFEVWPVHCLAGTNGARFPDWLCETLFDANTILIFKGSAGDGYSVFEGSVDDGKQTGITFLQSLKDRGIEVLYVVGLATDYCVKASVLDALRAYDERPARERYFLDVHVLLDCIAAVNVHPFDEQLAIAEMASFGAIVETSDALS